MIQALRSKPTLVGTLFLTAYFSGYFSILATAPSILVDVYFFPPSTFAWLFALAAFANGVGAYLCQRLIPRVGARKVIRLAVVISVICGTGSLLCLVQENTGIVLFWSLVMLFCVGLGIVLSAAVAIAINPLPKTAGFASSVLGTIQVSIATVVSGLVSTFYVGNANGTFIAQIGVGLIMLVTYVVATSRGLFEG